MAIDRENLKCGLNLRLGHLQDQSNNSNNGTVTAAEIFKKDKNGWCVNGYNGGYIAIADSASLDLDAFTIVFEGDFSTSFSGTQYLFDRASAGGGELRIWISAANTLSINDGTNTRTWTITAAQLVGARSLKIIKASGAAIPDLYINGVYHSAASGTINIPSNAQGIKLLSDYTGANNLNYNIGSFWLYNSIKTAAQVAAIHNEVIKLKTVNAGTRFKDSVGSVHAGIKGLVSGWNMAKGAGGKVMDVKNVNHGTIVNPVLQERTPWGEPCMNFNGTTGYLNCSNNSSLNFTTESFGGMCWIKLVNTSGGKYILTRGAYSASGWMLYQNSAVLEFYHNQAAAFQKIVSSVALTANNWYQAGFYSVAGNNMYIFQNGADVSTGTQARTNPVTNTNNMIIGGNSLGGSLYGGCVLAPVIMSGLTYNEFLSELLKEYNRVARKVIYKQDFENSVLLFTAIGSGTLPGTDIEVISGTHKISVATINGKLQKVLECATAGVVAIPIPQGNSAYGTFECNFYKADASSMNFQFISSSKTYASANGYQIQLDTDEACDLEEVAAGTPTALMTSAASAFSAATWTKLKITRTTEGIFTVKLNDVNVTAATGSNPVTDTTYTGSQWILIDCDAGDKIWGITKYFGVI